MADAGITISQLWQSIEKRFDKQDSLLAELQRAQSSFATKSDIGNLNGKIDGIDNRVKEIEKTEHKQDGKTELRSRSMQVIQSLVWPFIGISLTVTALIINH
jgi:hypothetical protein